MIRLVYVIAFAAATAGAAPITLTAPAPGATLRGGSFALLTWSAEQLPPGSEEWESFLSIDGGAHYDFRITPHLDIALRQVTWLVPNVDTGNARILIRVGDEQQERGFELPQRLTIIRDVHAALPRFSLARKGDDGVLGWAEGDRKATRIAHFMNVAPSRRMVSIRFSAERDASLACTLRHSRALGSVRNETKFCVAVERSNHSATPQLWSAATLLLCRRRNI